jgi:small GTP-binding protein
MDAYKRYVSATTDAEKVKYLEEYLSVIPKHKGTEKERGILRRKLALLRESIEKRAKKGGGREVNVRKQGAVQIIFAGFPNVGKSSLLRAITNSDAKVASYAFTTIEPNVGMLELHNVSLQMVDLPGLIKGAAEGRGMGKRFLSVLRNSDVIAFFLAMDDQPLDRLDRLMHEFEVAAIRLNQEKPDVKIYKKDSGGINLLGDHLLTCSKQDAIETCRDFGILNADVRINHRMGLEDFVDAIDKSTVWKKAFVILNKIDLAKPEDVKRTVKLIKARFNLPTMAISVTKGENLEKLKNAIWEICGLMRIYTVTNPHSDPLVIPKGSTILVAATQIHSDFANKFKYARVWGKSAKYDGQRVGKDHILLDGDVIELNA